MDANRLIPPPQDDDDEDVHWALSTAGALWGRGEREEALRWLRKAAEQASDVNADMRALELFKAAADVANKLTASVAPPPPPQSTAPPAPTSTPPPPRTAPPMRSAPPPPPVRNRPAPAPPAQPTRLEQPRASTPAAPPARISAPPVRSAPPPPAAQHQAPPPEPASTLRTAGAKQDATTQRAGAPSPPAAPSPTSRSMNKPARTLMGVAPAPAPAPASAPAPDPRSARGAPAQGRGAAPAEGQPRRSAAPAEAQPRRSAGPAVMDKALPAEDVPTAARKRSGRRAAAPSTERRIGWSDDEVTMARDAAVLRQELHQAHKEFAKITVDDLEEDTRVLDGQPEQGKGAPPSEGRLLAETMVETGRFDRDASAAGDLEDTSGNGHAPLLHGALPAVRVAVLGTASPGEVRLVRLDDHGDPPAGAATAILVPLSAGDGDVIARLFTAGS